MSANSINRKISTASISCLLVEAGFDSADNQALETLVEMMQSCKYIDSEIVKVGLGSVLVISIPKYSIDFFATL